MGVSLIRLKINQQLFLMKNVKFDVLAENTKGI
ncbi:hypothetical protein FHS68_000830 [Dyadobacter arcticus]|uniref:Uncharacterized protein n=1 Tax=Dyadobacter arcticus TaxID=1078754 RepID=A0ABX0UHZ7_9BACT|nr:hypothetical protein [Dyadobacter arcticus]